MKRKITVAALAVLATACAEDLGKITAPQSETSAQMQIAFSRRIPGQYIVVFANNDASAEQLAHGVSKRHGATVLHSYNSALKGMAVSLPDGAAAALARDPDVAYIEQDQIMTINSAASGNGALANLVGGSQTNAPWHLDRVDQPALPLDGLYNFASNGSGVRIYAIGAGIRYSHSEFNGRAVLGIDKVNPGGDGSACLGSSTFGAGISAGSTYGVAKGAQIVSVVVVCNGSATASRIIAGVDWVSANRVLPAVASLDAGFSSVVASLNAAVEASIASGVTYVVPAGNGNADLGIPPANACSASPASALNAITVGISRADDSFGPQSNYGPCVSVNAPGYQITSSDFASDNGTLTSSGSGPASHVVAGVAALYLSEYPDATPGTVRAALLNGATSGALSSLPAGTPNLLIYNGGTSPLAQPATAARFSYSCAKLSCTFNASGSVNAISSTWTFGDGTTGTGVIVSHTYAKPKGKIAFTVTLKIVDGIGAQVTTSKTINCNNTSCS